MDGTKMKTKPEEETKALNERDKKLRSAADPLIKFLSENHHPHVTAIVTSTGIELMKSIHALQNIHDFITD